MKKGFILLVVVGMVFGMAIPFQSIAQEENQQQAAKTTGKVIIFFVDESLDPPRLPSVKPGDKNKLLYVKEDSKGNKVEIWSDSGEYHLDFHRADGKESRVGRCNYGRGQNAGWAIATVEYRIIRKPRRAIPVYPGEIEISKIIELHKIYWVSYDAVGDPPEDKTKPGPWTGSNDVFYIYDNATHQRVWYNTTHQGRWVFDKRFNRWVWERRSMKYVEKHGPEEPPSIKDHRQSFYSEPLCEKKEALAYSMDAYTPEYTVVTPFPVTAFVNGTPETYVFRVPYWAAGNQEAETHFHKISHWNIMRTGIIEVLDSANTSESEEVEVVRYLADEIEIEKIEAFENELFSFDIEMPDEDLEILTYSLVTGPEGMTIDSLTGVINWTPAHTQRGEHEVVISIEYYGLSPDTGWFILTVVGGPDIPRPCKEWTRV